ncbi:MAG: hypothetical protein WCO09_01135 [bacterium]
MTGGTPPDFTDATVNNYGTITCPSGNYWYPGGTSCSVISVYHWKGGNNDNGYNTDSWDNPLNWVEGSVPVSGADVEIGDAAQTNAVIPYGYSNDNYGGVTLHDILQNVGFHIVNNSIITDITGTFTQNGLYMENYGTITNISGTFINSSNDGLWNGGTINDISGLFINSGSSRGIVNLSGTVGNISGTLINSGGGIGIFNSSGTIYNFSGTLINSGGGYSFYNTDTVTNISGTIYNFLGGLNFGIIDNNGNQLGHTINLPVADGKIWTNASSTNDWDNPGNWFLGVPANKTNDNVILTTDIILPDNVGNSFYIVSNGVTINGQNDTISGDINGNGFNGYNGSNGYNFALNNVTVLGSVTSNGGDANNQVPGTGGTISIFDSNVGYVSAMGGAGYVNPWSLSGHGGVVNITRSISGSVSVDGGIHTYACGAGGGGGGYIYVTENSTTTSLSAKGGNANYASNVGCDNGKSGKGGVIDISWSNTGSIDVTGGGFSTGYVGAAGDGGSVYLTHAVSLDVYAKGGAGDHAGGVGGNVAVNVGSIVNGSISTDGGSSGGTGGNGGVGGDAGYSNIVLGSIVNGSVSASGGVGYYIGGAGNNITVTNSRINGDLSTIAENVSYTDAYGFSSGNINISEGSVVTGLVKTKGGDSAMSDAGGAGDIAVAASVVQSILSQGGFGNFDGSRGGAISISASSTVLGDINSNGGASNYFAGAGGAITIRNSNAGGPVSSLGGSSVNTNGGDGGAILIDNSETGSIHSDGGYSDYMYGNGGTIIISGTDLDFSNKTISTAGGRSLVSFASSLNGYLTLTYNNLTTTPATMFNNIGSLTINNTSYIDTSSNSSTCNNGVPVGEGCAWNGIFNPLVFYFANTDPINPTDWNTVGNWWNDRDHTIQASSTPEGYSQVFIDGVVSTGTDAKVNAISFNGTSSNSINITVTNSATFNDSSLNTGAITLSGVATFNDSSLNTGTITAATSTFYEDNSSTVGGTVIGFIQRIFTQSATSIRKFSGAQAEGGRSDWTIISTGVNTIVNLANATYDLATNFFKGLLGGTFVSNSSIVTAPFFSQWFEVTSASLNGNKNWQSITSNSTGEKLAAVENIGSIYTSNNSGITWRQVTSSPVNGNKNWYSITSNSTGDKLAAVEYGGRIYTSTTSGDTWIQVTASSVNVNKDWKSITSNDVGDKLAAVVRGGSIYTSTTSGATWTQVTSSPVNGNKNWQSITSNSTGEKLAAVENIGSIYTSNNSGITWRQVTSSPVNGNKNWYSITSNSTGDKLAAVEYGGRIYTSTTSGDTWIQVTASSVNVNKDWKSITSNDVGDKLAAVVRGGSIYTSTTSGATWTQVTSSPVNGNKNWVSITSNDVGDKLAAVEDNGFIYTTAIESGTGIPVVPTVTINSPIAKTVGDTTKWAPNIDWGTAKSCQYSYDNWTTTKYLDCSSRGSDIPRPTAGEHVLDLRAIDNHGGLTEKSITYVYNNTVATYTMCGTDFLDEATRPYYYLQSDVTGPCTVTSNRATTILKGNISPTSAVYKVTGNIVGNGHHLDISNITVTGTINSSGGNIALASSKVEGNITANGASLLIQNATTSDLITTAITPSGSAGNITVSTSTTGRMYANGVDGANAGGNGGNITVWNSDGILASTLVQSNGGKVTANCGGNSNSYGKGGNINITNSDNYIAESLDGTRTCSSVTTGGQSSGTIVVSPRPPYVPPTPPASPTTPVNNAPSDGGGGGGFFSGLDVSNLGKLNLANLPSIGLGGLGNLGNDFGVSSLVNPLNDILKLKPLGKFDNLPSFDLAGKVDSFLNNSMPKSLVDLSKTVPSIKKALTSANITNGYDLYAMKDSPVNTPTLTELNKEKAVQPESLIFVSVDGKEKETKLSIDKKGNVYQIVTVEPYATLDVSVKNTAKTKPVAVWNGKVVTTIKDKKNIIKFSVMTPKGAGSYNLRVGTLTLEVRVVTPQPVKPSAGSGNTGTQKKLSPIQKLWSWFGK